MSDSIRFAGDLPPVAVFAVALAAAALVTWYYLRESRNVASPYSYLLPGLRASAVALTILVLAGPVWHRRQVIGTLGRVVFAVDTSQSMATTDSIESDSSPDRLARALRMLTGHADTPGWLESLRDSHVVDVIAFSEGDPVLAWTSRDDEELPAVLPLSAEGNRTDLSVGMSTTLASLAAPSTEEESQSVGRAALVLLSDGRDNSGPSPVDVAERLADAGVPVHAIGMGSEDDPTDIGIVNVVRPESVASDGQLAGEIVLSRFGMGDQPTTLRIESGGEVVWQETIPASSDGQQSVPFALEVEPIIERLRRQSPRGVQRSTVVMELRAMVEPANGESSTANNALPFRVAVSTRDRRLLILDGSSRWETRYIRNLFERDPAWSVDTVLFGPGTDMPTVRRGTKPGEFPESRDAIASYDAIVLGQIPPDQLSVTDANLLREFVTRGGGMIIVDGRYDRLKTLAKDALADLIPVTYLNETPMVVRALRPTRMGMDHPVLNLWGEKRELEDFWENLKSPPTAPRIRAQADAEVWAHAVGTDGRESPWLVSRLYGAGRVFYLSTDQTWRWRYKVADRFHARFWNQLLHAVMQPPYSANDDFVALGTDKIEYGVGDSATIRVRLQDTGGKPVGDATVDALLVNDQQVVATVPLTIDDPARGTYRGQTPPLEMGAFEIRVRASGFDATALRASTPIWVGDSDTVELGRVSLDKNALVQISQTGGGQYFHESSADGVLDLLEPLSSGRVVESDTLVWQSFYWFWAIMLLLTLEWWMRKKAGLV